MDILSGPADTEFRLPVGHGFRGLRFKFSLLWAANGTGLRKTRAMLNGATGALGTVDRQQTPNSAGVTPVEFDTFIPMVAADVATSVGEQTSGGTLNLLANSRVEIWGE